MSTSNPAANREAQRRYRKAHPEKMAADKRLHYTRHRDAVCAKARAHRRRNPEKQKAQRLRYAYGITAEQYAALVAAQHGACAICGKTPGRPGLRVDHCHVTGVVRGLLCMLCSSAIGKLGDSPAVLRAAASYLEERLNGVLPTAGEN